MIIREWRGRASPSRGEAYPDHFRARVLPQLALIPGFVGASLARRRVDDRIEFLVLTRWRSLDAIRAFTGDALDKAVVEPDAVAALLDFDAAVQHYEVVAESPSPTAASSASLS
jgi:heme-degrading monooxygenase HmoA